MKELKDVETAGPISITLTSKIVESYVLECRALTQFSSRAMLARSSVRLYRSTYKTV
jgi:hypothetical protein